MRDTLDVLRQVPALAGVERVGLAGSRFGATVAALVADASGSTDLLMFHPIVNGRKYATELLRSRVLLEMLGDDPSASTTVEGLRADLASDGLVNVKGWRLYGEVYEELCGVDLLAQLERFSGRALVVQVSRGTSPQSSLSRLVARLEKLGARAEFEVLTHPSAPNFGYEHFRPVGKDQLGDILEGVNQRLSEMALSWVERDRQPAGEAR
jgi:hypothetical protein